MANCAMCRRNSDIAVGAEGSTATASHIEMQQLLPAILSRLPELAGGASQCPASITCILWCGEAAIAAPETPGAMSTDSATRMAKSFPMLMRLAHELAGRGVQLRIVQTVRALDRPSRGHR